MAIIPRRRIWPRISSRSGCSSGYPPLTCTPLEPLGLSRRFPAVLGWSIEPIARRLGRKSIERSPPQFMAAVRGTDGRIAATRVGRLQPHRAAATDQDRSDHEAPRAYAELQSHVRSANTMVSVAGATFSGRLKKRRTSIRSGFMWAAPPSVNTPGQDRFPGRHLSCRTRPAAFRAEGLPKI